jgi:branched-chain amino acid transport system substrate-binding protein
MRGWSRLIWLALVFLAAACTSSEPPSTTLDGEIRIGVLAPLSGGDRAVGTEALRGAQLAAAMVNGEEGDVSLAGVGADGLDGARIAVVPGDTAGDPTRGATEAARLITAERVVGLVGAFHNEVTNAASLRSERLQVPFVNGDASAEFLTERDLDWFFRTGPTDRMFGEAFLSALGVVDDPPVRTVAVLNVTDRPGSVIAKLTSELAEQGEFQVVAKVGFDPDQPDLAPADQPDLAPAVSQVQAKKPDAVFAITSSPGQTERLLGTFRELGYTPPGLLTFAAGFLEPPVLQAAGRDGQGLLYSAGWSREVAARNPAAKPIMELYEERFGGAMSEVAAGSFTAMLTLAQGIADAGSVEPERVRAALLNLDIPGRDTIMPWNGVRFDGTHQNVGASGVVEQVGQEAVRIVFPAELAQEEAKWPLSSARA